MAQAFSLVVDWLVTLAGYGIVIALLGAYIQRKRTRYVKNGF